MFDVVEEEEAILILETTLTSGDLSTAQLQHVGQIPFFSQQEALCVSVIVTFVSPPTCKPDLFFVFEETRGNIDSLNESTRICGLIPLD